MSTKPLARALAAWQRAHGTLYVSSVGVNEWAETTFSVPTGATGFGAPRHRLGSFDANGKLTSGNAGYASDPGDAGFSSNPEDPLPISAVRPVVLTRLISTIRASQSDTKLLQAVLNLDRHTNRLAWHVEVVTPHAGSSIVYYAATDGSGLCHERDNVPKDALVPAPGIPSCPFFVTLRSLNFSRPDNKLLTGVTVERGQHRRAQRTNTAPRAPVIPPSAAQRLDCVKKAAGDVSKLVLCSH
jgi:hypothetical protein